MYNFDKLNKRYNIELYDCFFCNFYTFYIIYFNVFDYTWYRIISKLHLLLNFSGNFKNIYKRQRSNFKISKTCAECE